MQRDAPLVDTFGRTHANLRISVTDRCNIRCFYCMPMENVQFKPREEILSYEEIARFARIMAPLGVSRIRLTGGEPLVRADLASLIKQLVSTPGIEDIALTTNGILLADQADALKEAGMHRVNISLDSLNEQTFRRIARRDGLHRVLEGIFAAQRVGFQKVRLNAVTIQGITDEDVIPLGGFARRHGLEMRFIEFMPLDAENRWKAEQVLSGKAIRQALEDEFGPLVPLDRNDPSQPAVDYQFADGIGRVGFINPVSEPFCESCNRVRLTADGKFRSCLFASDAWDVRTLLREGASDQEIVRMIRDCVMAKKPGHLIDRPDFVKPQHAMYQIGG